MTNELFEKIRLTLVISRQEAAPKNLLELVDLAFQGGVSAVQMREKSLSGKDLYHEAKELAQFCRERKRLFIVNDRLDVALAVGADGVHLGQDDLPAEVARRVAPKLIIGVSVHNVAEAEKAIASGASYLGLGAMFPTGSKSDVSLISKNSVRAIIKMGLPSVAIGGINVQNAPEVWALGFHGLAVISALAAATDPIRSARQLLEPGEPRTR